ncbi:MAG: PIG-L family deacetylase, partial [Phycisphaerales bacterium]|nr:PIG-L family deacetylase [Phycisphaerales bacterium]
MSGLKSHIRDAFTLFTVGRRARELVEFAKSHFLVTLAPDATWRALVIAPHPDDESIGCGGTVAGIVAAGGAVDVMFITDGGEGVLGDDEIGGDVRARLKNVRIEEAERACAVLGVREIFRLKARDGGVSERMDLAAPLAEQIDRGRYTHVFAPWPYDL